MFLSERNLAFRGSEEVLGSPHNGNFLGIFELLARRDPILKELQDRIKNKNTKDHYLSPTIQNELIELLATEVEKENLQQLKLAKYFSIILDCTQSRSTPTSGPPKVSARAPAHRSYHCRGVKLKSCIKKIHHNLYISKQANVRIKHADTEGASHKKFGTDARVQ